MPLQIVEVADTGIGASVGYAFPVATSTAIYWFPTSSGGGDIIKYHPASDTVSTISTGVAHGWAGATLGDDGLIYATPTETHRTVLRLNPTSGAVATTTYSSLITPRNLGVPVAVTVAGQQRIYAFPAGIRGTDNRHRLFLRINCDTFTATAWDPGSSVSQRLCGDSIAHPNGRIYATPKDQGTGYTVLALNPVNDTFAQVVAGTTAARYSAMVLQNSTTTSPIYLFGDAGIAKLSLTPSASVTNLGAGVGQYDSGDRLSGRHPALLLSTGNILGVPTNTDNARRVNTATDTLTTVTLSDQRFASGGVIGGNGKGYWFDSNDSEALEYDPATNGVGYVIPDTLDFRTGGEPVNLGGNVYVLSQGGVGITRRVGVIQLATPPTAIIVATPTTGTPPLMVAFDGTTSLAPAGGIYAYGWDFGDGNTSTSPTPIHSYTSPGTYTVTLTIVDIVGQSDTATVTIRVRSGRRGLGLIRG